MNWKRKVSLIRGIAGNLNRRKRSLKPISKHPLGGALGQCSSTFSQQSEKALQAKKWSSGTGKEFTFLPYESPFSAAKIVAVFLFAFKSGTSFPKDKTARKRSRKSNFSSAARSVRATILRAGQFMNCYLRPRSSRAKVLLFFLQPVHRPRLLEVKYIKGRGGHLMMDSISIILPLTSLSPNLSFQASNGILKKVIRE